MGQFERRDWLLLVVVLVVATGCLRSATSEELASPESRQWSSPTPLPTEPPTFTPQPTMSQLASPTPFPTEQVGMQLATPTTGQFLAPTQETPVQLPSEQIDPRYVEATRIVAEATQRAIDATQTAQGPVFAVPTFTPTTDPFQTQTTPIPIPIQPGADCVHEVVAGENLFRLSMRYGVPIMDIARASSIYDVERLSIGQRLVIPGCGTTGVVPPPTSTPSPAPGTPIPSALMTTVPTQVPSAGGIAHRVQQGETLFIISQRYGVPIDVIARANNITDYDRIYFNQELVIP